MKFKKLTPNMMVNDVKESVKFYTEVLGFNLNMIVAENSKEIESALEKGKNYSYAMVSRDEVYIMLMQKNKLEKDIPMLKDVKIGASVSFYCNIDNIDEMYNLLKENRCQKLSQNEYRRASFFFCETKNHWNKEE